MIRLTTIFMVGVLLFLVYGCNDTNSKRIQIRNYILEDGIDSLMIGDTLEVINSGVVFKSGNPVLKKIFIWDSLIISTGITSDSFLSINDNTLRITDTLSTDLKQVEISYKQQNGGSLAITAYYLDGVGIVYYQPWDSKSIFWLQEVINVEGISRDTIDIQVVDKIISFQPLSSDTTEVSDELGEIKIEY